MYSYGPPHIAEQKQDDQLEDTYSSYVRIRDVVLKTCQRRWMIGRMAREGQGYPCWRHDMRMRMMIHSLYTCIYSVFIYIYFHHTTCESTWDTLASSAANQGDNTVSVAQGGTATPGATEQLLPPNRVFKRNIYLCIHKIN